MTISELRCATGWTQVVVAQRMGVTQATVSRWECGKLPMSERDRLAADRLADEAARESAAA